MKLKSIFISNIYSFKPQIEEEGTRICLNPEGNLSINIGPNGAGKSNFLEITSKIFNGILFQKYNLNLDNIRTFKLGTQNIDLQNTINFRGQGIPVPFYKFESNSVQMISLEFIFSEKDLDNIKLISDNFVKIQSYASKYSKFNIGFNKVPDIESLKEPIKITLQRNDSSRRPNADQNNTFTLVSSNEIEQFTFHFLQKFNFLQCLIELINYEEGASLTQLGLTYTILNANRSHQNLNLNYALNNTEQNLYNQIQNELSNVSFKVDSNYLPALFKRVLHTLSFVHHNAVNLKGVSHADQIIASDPTYLSLKKYLNDFLGIEFVFSKNISQPTPTYFATMKRGSENLNINELSSGEMAILTFIFAVLGDELKDGFILIDEPEVHLHPQMQKIFSELIETARKENNSQIIYVTHSPYFINFQHIHSVNRFYKEEKSTKSISPEIETKDKDLFKILNVTNNSTIFFSSKVILVEGETDEYFFRSLFEKLLESEYSKYKSGSIEFLKIGGKGNFKSWRDFLNKFKVKNYYIGDLDNIKDLQIGATQIQEARESLSGSIDEKKMLGEVSIDRASLFHAIEKFENSKSADDFKEVIEIKDYWKTRKVEIGSALDYLKSHKNDKFKEILEEIDSQYAEGIFVLKEGDLENYLGISKNKKGIESVIKFCKEDLNDFISAEDSRFLEIKNIIQKILEDE